LEDDLVELNDKLQQEAQCIPNMTHPDVPIGGEDCSTIRKMVFQLLQISSFFSSSRKRLVVDDLNALISFPQNINYCECV